MAKRKAPPAATPDQRFEALRALPQEELAALLAEVAATHPEVEERLARHALSGHPARLAAEFRKRLQSWKRSGHFFGRGAAAEFGRELEAWLDETERELLPLDPAGSRIGRCVRAQRRMLLRAGGRFRRRDRRCDPGGLSALAPRREGTI
jgi:hypothetical protein